jgi:hypothetical protein
MRQNEFEAMITDSTKTILGDIAWSEDEDHSPVVEFRVQLRESPLFVKGSFNPLAKTLSFTLFHPASGRLYGLDLGKDHRNPDGQLVGEKHKHRWKEPIQAREAYVPPDITASVDDPVAVWSQFCLEAAITHNGILHCPPVVQLELL